MEENAKLQATGCCAGLADEDTRVIGGVLRQWRVMVQWDAAQLGWSAGPSGPGYGIGVAPGCIGM